MTTDEQQAARVINERTVLVGVDKLEPHPRNPRVGNVDVIAESIRHNGFYGVIVAQKSTGYVVAGNHRLKAARQVGLAKVPVVYVDVGDDEAIDILLADNRTSDVASYNNETLLQLLQEVEARRPSLAGTGYDRAALKDLLGRVKRAEPVAQHGEDSAGNTGPPAELQKQWKTRPGQTWRIPSRTVRDGEHRITCGDARTAGIIETAMNGGEADGVWTDPPYGVKYEGGSKQRQAIISDDAEGLHELLTGVLGTARTVCRPGATWYVTGPSGANSRIFLDVLSSLGVWRQTLIWVKDNSTFAPIGQDYHWRHEFIYYGWVEGAKHTVPQDRKQDSIWDVKRPNASVEHPTMKPVELVTRALHNSTLPDDVVLDPFAGSGTTLVGCEQTARQARLVEVNPAYVAVALQRASSVGLVPELVK